MPSSDRLNVRNTLMLYSTTSTSTLPCVHSRISRLDAPTTMMPFCRTSRVDRSRKWRGTHESDAMFDSTAGPSRKPVCAPTSSSPASNASTAPSSSCRANAEPSPSWSITLPNTTALSVLPSTGAACHSM